jgi:hypothetical protein
VNPPSAAPPQPPVNPPAYANPPPPAYANPPPAYANPPPAYGGQPSYGQPLYGQQHGISVVPPGLSDKSKVAAGLLQLLLGGFGAGRFYTGHTGIAIAQIAATWLTCGLGVIWPVVDGILMLMGNVPDAQGRRLRD